MSGPRCCNRLVSDGVRFAGAGVVGVANEVAGFMRGKTHITVARRQANIIYKYLTSISIHHPSSTKQSPPSQSPSCP